MRWTAAGLILVNAGLFTTLGVWAVLSARRESSPRLRALRWLVAIVCVAFMLGALHRLALQADAAGLVSRRIGDLLLTDLQVAKSLATLVLATLGLFLVRRASRSMQRLERLVAVLADGIPPERVVQSALTRRELEVLEVLSRGHIADEAIAEALGISPATAKTHVRNILAKTGAGSRRAIVAALQGRPPLKAGHDEPRTEP